MSVITEDMVFPSWWPESKVIKARRILGRLPYNRRARRLDAIRCMELATELERKERERKFEAKHAPAYDAYAERVKAADRAWKEARRKR